MKNHDQKFRRGDIVRPTEDFARIMGTDDTFNVLGEARSDGDGPRFAISARHHNYTPTVPYYGIVHA